MKPIMENWRRFKRKVDENKEMQQRLYKLTDEYTDKKGPNIKYERLQDITQKVYDMMHPHDPSAKPIEIKDLGLKGSEEEFASKLYDLNKELKRGPLEESMVPHAKIAGKLVNAVNKFGFRKLSNNEHSQLRDLLYGLRDKRPIDARDSIIDFLVGKRLANRSLFYNIR